jgi:selenium metabolism protein YedF
MNGGNKMREVDGRGLVCPQPVILTKKALEAIDHGEITAIVDNMTAKGNVCRLADNLNLPYEIVEKDGCFYITIKKQGDSIENVVQKEDNIVIVIASDKLGQGDPQLGQLLMKSYTYALGEVMPLPKKMIFLNSGVKLACEGSEALLNIEKLACLGVEIICCGTCLDFYSLKDKLKVGIISNMYVIIESMHQASSVINIG